MLINIDQYRSILINIDQYWSISINIGQYRSILINIDQYWLIMHYSISINIDQYRSILINIDQYWSILINHALLITYVRRHNIDQCNHALLITYVHSHQCGERRVFHLTLVCTYCTYVVKPRSGLFSQLTQFKFKDRDETSARSHISLRLFKYTYRLYGVQVLLFLQLDLVIPWT